MGIYADRGPRSPSLQFRRFNLIYGFNGSGKSTLSRMFASLEAGARHSKLPEGGSFEVEMDDGSTFGCPTNPAGLEQRVLVFNSDYIEQNLQWSAGRANPIFYIGADQAEAAAELTQIEGDIVKVSAREEAARAAEQAAEKTFSNFKRERARSVASRLHLGNRKYEAPALAKDYETWKADEKPPLTYDELKAAEDTRRLDQPMPRLELVSFDQTTIGTAYRFIADVCSQSLAQVSLVEVQRHPDMLLWLKQGHEYHERNNIAVCIHCGNPVSPERRALLTAALDESVDQFVARLAVTAGRLEELVETTDGLASQIPATDDLSPELRAGFKAARDGASVEVRLLVNQLRTLETVLIAKRERPASPANMQGVAAETDVLATAERLAAKVAGVNDAIATHNQAVADFTKRKDAAGTSIRRHFIVECRLDYERAAKELDEAKGKLSTETEALARLRQRSRDLRTQIQIHGPAADVINKLIAAYLGHGELTINPVDEGYELHRHGTRISGAPSEGEKTAIAIAYFLSSLEADNRKLKNTIVVVDDPVSSLDTRALNFACSLVRTRLEKAAQVFILTHNLQCMNGFKKGWKGKVRPAEGKEQTATFLFIDVSIPEGRQCRSSNIVQMSKLLREYDSEYHFLFSQVLRFIDQRDKRDDHGYMIPNVIRRVLDVFLAFKAPGGLFRVSSISYVATTRV